MTASVIHSLRKGCGVKVSGVPLALVSAGGSQGGMQDLADRVGGDRPVLGAVAALEQQRHRGSQTSSCMS